MNAQFQSGCNQSSWLQWHTSVKSQMITEEEPSSCQPADARRIIWKALFLLLCALSLSPCTHCNYKYDNLSRVTSMKWNDVMYYCRNTCLGKQTKQHEGKKHTDPAFPIDASPSTMYVAQVPTPCAWPCRRSYPSVSWNLTQLQLTRKGVYGCMVGIWVYGVDQIMKTHVKHDGAKRVNEIHGHMCPWLRRRLPCWENP